MTDKKAKPRNVTISLKPHERELLQDAADRDNRKLAQYIRHVALRAAREGEK